MTFFFLASKSAALIRKIDPVSLLGLFFLFADGEG